MKPALIEGAPNNPGQPRDWTAADGECGRLPVKVIGDPSGRIARCVSAWKPTLEELAVLLDGGFVELHVWGWQVPCALSVTDRRGAQELG